MNAEIHWSRVLVVLVAVAGIAGIFFWIGKKSVLNEFSTTPTPIVSQNEKTNPVQNTDTNKEDKAEIPDNVWRLIKKSVSPTGDTVIAEYEGENSFSISAARYGEVYGDTKGWIVTLDDAEVTKLPEGYTNQKEYFVKNPSADVVKAMQKATKADPVSLQVKGLTYSWEGLPILYTK